MNLAALGRAGLALLYPIAIYFALQWFQPRVIAIGLAVVLLIRQRHSALKLLTDLPRISHAILIALLALCVVTFATNSEALLRLYPAAMAFGVLALFALTLSHPPSMIERFARLRQPNLPPEGVAYTRRVTIVWCGFLTLNGLFATWTAFYASREVWLLYNGLLIYVLMGLLFVGEWLYRRWRYPEARA